MYYQLIIRTEFPYKSQQEDFVEKDKITLNYLCYATLSHFSCVRLCVTPQTAAHQAPPSLGFSRQEHWSGLPFPSPMHESESEVAQLCPTLSDPMDCSPTGSSIHGIFQARVLEWGAIAFSTKLWKSKHTHIQGRKTKLEGLHYTILRFILSLQQIRQCGAVFRIN